MEFRIDELARRLFAVLPPAMQGLRDDLERNFKAVLRANPFDTHAERGILEHMNADHGDALRHYCALAGLEVPADEAPEMVGCDGEGMHLRLGLRVARIPFPAPVADMQSVRATLVAMARAERLTPPG